MSRRIRLTGSILAVSIAAIIGAAGQLPLLVDRLSATGHTAPASWTSASSAILLLLGIFGAPVAGLLGWMLSPLALSAAGWAHLAGTAARMGVAAVILSALEMSGVGSIVSALLGGSTLGPTDLAVTVVWALAIGLVGTVLVGPFALFITLPAALIWVLLLRLLVQTFMGSAS